MKVLTNKNEKAIKIFITVFVAGVFSRLFFLFVSAIVMKCIDVNINIFEFLIQASDAPHYLYIAENGYAASGDAANKIVFYPLLPYMMKVFQVLFRSYAVSGFVISYASFGIASAYLYKLMRLDYSEEKALDALLLLFLAPFGMFFVSIHTESLFIMLSAMVLYYTRKENWIAASIIGFFAALSKSQGVLLFVPVGYEIILSCVRDKKFYKKGLFAFVIPMGFIIYLCINKALQGEFFAFMAHQAAAPWYNNAKWISDSLSTSYSVGIDNYSLSMIIYWPQIVLFFVSVLFLFVGLYKKVRTSYLAFMGVYILVTYLQGWMISGARYVTSCIVMYIVMASIDNKYLKYIMYLISGSLTLCMMILWLRGYAIM